MSGSQHYISNLRDLTFNLFEFLEVDKRSLGRGPYEELDEETVRDMLREFEKLCVGELASSFVEGDRVPLKRDEDGEVTLPEGIKRSMRAFYEGEWHRLGVPSRLGGVGVPPTVEWAAYELAAGANPTVAFYTLGSFFALVLDQLGTQEQKDRFVANILDNHWGCTMVLTEPDAGSDVGAGRTKATHIEGDLWHIEGVKRFITGGEMDFSDNIVHFVLARPEGAGVGTKGLSMFLVPKYWVNEDGSLGERNGVKCTNIEKKMGLKGSTTCELTFGDGLPAKGLLVGNNHDGIRQMFHVIEQARMAVGMKSVATLSTAYLNALAYAKERVQGPDLLEIMDKTSPRVSILRHPDVRRMLMMQKAYAEGMRALGLYTAWTQDQVRIAGGRKTEEGMPWDRRNNLLLPLVKGYCSEKVYELLSLSLQCFGGSGYVQDYPIEQYIRDQKIDTLYEGTTHIQALDLFLRKVARDGGESLRALLGEVRETANGTQEALAVEHKALGDALDALEKIFEVMMGKTMESLYHVGLQGNRILFALAEVVIGWLLVRQSAIAHQKREDAGESDRKFYDGKIAAARFYCREVLPNIQTSLSVIQDGNLELMELPEDIF